jgi:LacI family transcriptional regulator
MATMSDVAQLAGVSESTVSHVINETRTVLPETAARVRAAIGELGYSPNMLAQSLARASTMSIGVAVPDIGNYYFAEVIHGIEAAASAFGYTLLLANTQDDADVELRVIRDLQQRRVDGVIVAPASGSPNAALEHLVTQKVPLALVDRLADARFDCVGIENAAAIGQLVDHLASLGHQRIGLISGRPNISTTIERIQGFRAAMERNGLPVDLSQEHSGGSFSGPARIATHELLAMANRPTAIVSGSNLMTMGVMRALSEAGLRVPDDMAVVSFDDFEWADLFAPRLTTVAQPAFEMGSKAVDLLLRRMKDPDAAPEELRLKVELNIRESCGQNLSRLR